MNLLPRFIPALTAFTLALTLQACSDENVSSVTSTANGTTANTANITVSIRDMPMATVYAADSSTFQDLDGRGLEIASFAGKRVFVNYWATWCAPCIREIPALTRAAAQLEDENFIFLLASDETPETITNFVADRGFSGNFIKLNGFFGGHGIDAVPSSSVYDEQGQLLHTWAGAYEWDSKEMLEQIRNPGAVQ